MSDLDRYQYGYDQNSNRLWKANVVGTAAVGNLDEGYAYDNLNRLTQMQRGTLSGGVISGTPVREMDYTLDPTGNWATYLTKTSGTTDLNQTRSHNMVNEIEVIGGTPGWASPPAYDAAGNMNSFPQPASPSSAYTAVYDAWNRMVSISGTGGTVATYQYDGRNRRIVKYITAISETRHFYWTNNWQDIEERTGSSTSMDKQYVWGARYIDELVCRDDATPLRLYLAQDANFNVTALISTSGVLQQRFLYDPYGNAFALTSSWASTTDGYTWARRFTGQFFDSETELYYNRARYYQPRVGTFLSRDPVQLRAGLNMFEYASSNPVNNFDPNGTQSRPSSPPTTGPTSCPVNNCGPDITDQLKSLMALLSQVYNGWNKQQQNAACEALKSKAPNPQRGGEPTAFGAWEIYQMHRTNDWLNSPGSNFPGCATGTCTHTVEVNGKCFDPDNVNYVIFGAMTQLCGWDPFSLDVVVVGWKGWMHGGENVLDATAWANAGWNGWPNGQNSPSGERTDCASCNTPYGGFDFLFYWAPNGCYQVGRGNAPRDCPPGL